MGDIIRPPTPFPYSVPLFCPPHFTGRWTEYSGSKTRTARDCVLFCPLILSPFRIDLRVH